MVLLYLLLIGRTIQLMSQGIKPFVLGIGGKGIKGILEISFSIVLLIWSTEIIINALKLQVKFISPLINKYFFQIIYLKITGTCLIGIGLIIFILALISFGKSWRVGIDNKNPGKLITNGIFSISRNPIFLFIDLFFIGIWFIYSNSFFLLASILVIIGIHYQILQEEKFLLKNYGNEYKSYFKKVRRYF